MRPNGTLVGTRWGPISALGRQPRRRHLDELRAGTPTRPWGSPRLPRTVAAGDPRRVLFRSLLRRAEGVPVEFADGSTGIVDSVVFSPIGFDFWAETLVVAAPRGKLLVPTRSVRLIDVREPLIWLDAPATELHERHHRFRDARDRHEQRLVRVQHRHDLVRRRVFSRRHREKPGAPIGAR